MTVAPTSAQPGGEPHRPQWVLVAILPVLLGGLTALLLYHFDVLGGSSNSTTSTIVGSGRPATQARDLAAFTSVELAGANNVLIRVGKKQSVLVRADRNLLNRVTTNVQSSKLVIANTPGGLTTRSPMSVDVNVPTLDALTLAGSGNVVIDGIEAESLDVALPGTGTVTGSGTAKRLDVTVGGSGTVQFTRLVANDARAVVSGSGSIFITATKALDASVSGSGAILYAGSPPEVSRSITGTGTITGS